MGKGAKGFSRAQADACTAFPSSIKVSLSQKEIRVVRQDLSKPDWLGLISCLSCTCCVITAQVICSRTFPSSWSSCILLQYFLEPGVTLANLQGDRTSPAPQD